MTSSRDAVKSICDVLGALSPISSRVAVLMSAGVRARNADGFQASHAPTDRLTRQARCAHFKLRWLQQNNNNRFQTYTILLHYSMTTTNKAKVNKKMFQLFFILLEFSKNKHSDHDRGQMAKYSHVWKIEQKNSERTTFFSGHR